MNLKPSGRILGITFLFALLSWAAMASQSGFVLRGPSFTTDVQMINGRAYVPLADVAKSLGMRAVRTGNTFNLVAAQSQKAGRDRSGRMDTDISSGGWTFRVLTVSVVPSYTEQFGSNKLPVGLSNVNDELIIVRCRLKNLSGSVREVYFDPGNNGNTALSDFEEHAYVPSVVDSRNSEYYSSRLPAGTVHEFALVFSVPKDTRVKDLIYSAVSPGSDKGTDFRVALKP